MPKYDPRIDAYIEKSADFAHPILNHLRELVHATCPDVEEQWKWSSPHFYYRGAPMCHMAAFKGHAAFGFWKGALLDNTDGVLELAEKHAMGHVGRLTTLKDLPKDAVIKKYIKAAMKLNDEGVKLPAAKRPAEKEKEILETPGYLVKALKKNKAAERVFNEFSYSGQKEYIEWLEEAKTEATRLKRLEQAIEWIAEGKGRHWKYKK